MLLELNKIYNEDCIETMKRIPDNSIDLMLTDPPYAVTSAEWDNTIDFTNLWAEWKRIVKPTGVFCFTATQPFATDLICSFRDGFKYELIWNKMNHSNPFVAPYRPLPVHENVLIFYRQTPTYNAQKIWHGRFGKKSKNGKNLNDIFKHEGKAMVEYDGYGNPMSILEFTKDSQNGNKNISGMHPTQKPIDLFRWLIKTYSNEGQTVYDGYMGSGTTAVACLKEKRNYIGSELNEEYYKRLTKRIEDAQCQTSLF